MNIIFTDIDGVLNTNWSKIWNKKCIEIYNRICKDFNLIPVVTSTWRMNYTIEKLQDIFNQQGIEAKIYDFTPSVSQAGRELEIRMWLSNHPTDKYVVVDDKNIELTNVIKCKGWIGLTEEHYNEIKKMMS